MPGLLAFDKLVGLKWMVENTSGPGMFAFVLATIFAIIAFIVFIMSFSKTLLTYNRATADMDADEFAEQQPILRWSSLNMVLLAATFVMLALGNMDATAPQAGYFWGVVATMAIQTGIFVYLWRKYDEFAREVTKQACTISFVIGETLLVIWAAATIFGLGITFDPLAVLVAMTSISTLITVALTVKKGMTQ